MTRSGLSAPGSGRGGVGAAARGGTKDAKGSAGIAGLGWVLEATPGEVRGSQKYTPAAALTAHTRPRAGEAKHVKGRGVIRVKNGINLVFIA